MKTLISKIESLVPAHFQLALFIMLLLFVSCFLGACTDKCEVKNVYLSIDENKGGIFTLSFESDEVPKATDFTYSTGSIGTPEGDWDFINQIFFKGQPLTIDDYLDNWGKTSNVEIFTSNGEVIK